MIITIIVNNITITTILIIMLVAFTTIDKNMTTITNHEILVNVIIIMIFIIAIVAIIGNCSSTSPQPSNANLPNFSNTSPHD